MQENSDLDSEEENEPKHDDERDEDEAEQEDKHEEETILPVGPAELRAEVPLP